MSTVVGVDMKKDLPKHLRKAFKSEEDRPVEGQVCSSKDHYKVITPSSADTFW